MPRLTVRLPDELLDRLDRVANTRGMTRAGTVRRLIETSAVDDLEPVAIPDTDELLLIASERAGQGNMAAVNFLASRQPDERARELHRLLARLGGSDG